MEVFLDERIAKLFERHNREHRTTLPFLLSTFDSAKLHRIGNVEGVESGKRTLKGFLRFD
jgi:hypothetical protein